MVNLPLPESLKKECVKAAKTLRSFRMPGNDGIDSVIPADIIDKAKGLVILTVVKAGFLFSGRVGFGLVLARLPNGEWSAPSSIGTGSFGAGLQIGAEITDFVIILNNQRAVDAFSMGGNVALGGNLSVAAGPVGRNAEASGMATIAATYSYSKTKGLFAGISLEGTVFVERSDANQKLYGHKVKPRELLYGSVAPPKEAQPLYDAIKLREESYRSSASHSDDEAPPSPAHPQAHLGYPPPPVPSSSSSSSSSPTPMPRPRSVSAPQKPAIGSVAPAPGATRPPRSSSIAPYPPSSTAPYPPSSTAPYPPSAAAPYPTHSTAAAPPSVAPKPRVQSGVPTPFASGAAPPVVFPKPTATAAAPAMPAPGPGVLPPRPNRNASKAKAIYDFEAQQEGDLSFKAGDVITITQKSENTDDWWTGSLEGRKGSFPANYVQLV